MAVRDPLLVPLAAIVGGIVFSRALQVDLRPATLAFLLLICLIFVSVRWISRYAAIFCVCAAIFFTGVITEIIHRPQPPPIIDFQPGESLILSGCVIEPPALSPDREQFVLELESHARVRINWYVKDGETPPALRYGQRIETEARLRNPRNFGNPGAFDFIAWLARRDIYWLGSANAKSRLEILPGACGSLPMRTIYYLRERSVARLDQMFAADAYALGMSRAVLLGDSARLERIWADDYRRTGTYHAIVISGIHLTVLAACFSLLFRLFGMTGLGALTATAGLCWIYALMTGSGAPVIRSAAGLTLFLGAHLFYRRARIINILAAVAIGFLIFDPDQLFDPSFQLSFLSVALIGALAAPFLAATTDPFADGLRQLSNPRRDTQLEPRIAELRVELRLIAETIEHRSRIPVRYTQQVFSALATILNFAWTMFAVSAIIQIGMLLPMIVYFHRFSITGVTANLLIIPAMNALVPVGFLAILTGWGIFARIASLLLALSRVVTEWHARWESDWRIPDPPGWVALLFLVTLLALPIAAHYGRRPRRIALAAFLSAAVLLVSHPFRPQLDRGLLEVTMIDVGQGDSLLIASPEGKLMLFDTGGFPPLGKARKPSMDIGEDVISPYLFTRSVKRIDVIAISHAHEDHIGGLRALVRNFRPQELWIGAFPPAPAWLALRAEVEKYGTRIVSPKAGEKRTWGGLRIDIVSPPEDYAPAKTPKNNDSLAFTVRFRERSILFTGDVERQMEARMIADERIRRVDVLKVAHHGSKTSTSQDFLDSSQPVWALISAGEGNLFHHPHTEVVKRLARAKVQMLRTDKQGQIRLFTDGHRWEIAPYWLQGNATPAPLRPMVY
ncbi:MAG: DNA internalization-related competence protein ComEC/Rec2 [Bryobacterales bacterium]|nr:DNA internalization-related competence protein ComEC/Rec2 [Bryobacterales bacterium]